MNQGIHTVDLMLWLAGPVRRVRAVAFIKACYRSAETGDWETVEEA